MINYGWHEDIWFHANNFSSAHVYLRLPNGPVLNEFRQTGSLSHIPQTLDDCLQIVKINSIEGKKKSSIDIIYTEFKNLKKNDSMDVGQVGFLDKKKVAFVKNIASNRDIILRLKKSNYQDFPDLEKMRKEHDYLTIQLQKKQTKEAILKKNQEIEQLKKEKESYSYRTMFNDDHNLLISNTEQCSSNNSVIVFEENFM